MDVRFAFDRLAGPLVGISLDARQVRLSVVGVFVIPVRRQSELSEFVGIALASRQECCLRETTT